MIYDFQFGACSSNVLQRTFIARNKIDDVL